MIAGRWVTETSHGSYKLLNPATHEVLATLPRCRSAQTNEAIEAAHLAFRAWRTTTATHRSQIVRRWYELVVSNRADLATLITLEEGKPLIEALGEIDYAASFLQWFSEEAKRVRGDVIPAPKGEQRILVLKQPVGVCAAITPWNFPAAMITRKAGPALAAGCSMVVKPASQTPLTALALGELALRAGVPAGLFSVITGDDARVVGAALTSHNLVRKVTFTGSTEVGRVLLQQSASSIKKCSMELGGNAPCIVFDDADIDVAVEGVLAAKFRNTGQSCIAANRVLVQDSIYDALVRRLAHRTQLLRVGNGLNDGSQIGPMIDDRAVGKVEQLLEDAVSKGAEILVGGKRHVLGGSFFQPTLIINVDQDMAIAHDEIFGPVMAIMRFTTDAQALELANASELGLAAYLFSQDAARIWRTAEELESGMVGVNTGLISTEVAPFGGIKQSGLGREGSQYGIDEFLEMKYVCWDGLHL